MRVDTFGTRGTFDTGSGSAVIYRLNKLAAQNIGHIDRLPFSIKILLENALRYLDNFEVTEEAVREIANWNAAAPQPIEIPFKPARVVLQDFTGVPTVVDLAALRSAMARFGGDRAINPGVPVDLVIDHSRWVQPLRRPTRFASTPPASSSATASATNSCTGAERLRQFPRRPRHRHRASGQSSNIWRTSCWTNTEDGQLVAYPDTLVGTDSHTTMINALGVLGWGVGGIRPEPLCSVSRSTCSCRR
ncbi:MAG: aconitase family protein [Anaerolineae bacterium]